MARITGGSVKLQRVETGLYTLDRAFEGFGKIGLPCHSLELYGPTSSGKTTLVVSLAGLIAKDKNIVMMDLEGNDQEMLSSILDSTGFTGELKIIEEDNHEIMLKELANTLNTDDFSVGILDSVGAISPIAETKGKIGDRNMGHRGFIMAQFSRKMNSVLRGNNKNFFAVNHVYQNLGMVGTTTPGGNALKYLAGNRVPIKIASPKNKRVVFSDGSYVIEGAIKKNRFGVQGRKFYTLVLAGKGVHLGLTAMYECMALGIVPQETGKKYWDKHIEKAHEGDNTVFQPFIEKLKSTTVVAEDTQESEETEDE